MTDQPTPPPDASSSGPAAAAAPPVGSAPLVAPVGSAPSAPDTPTPAARPDALASPAAPVGGAPRSAPSPRPGGAPPVSSRRRFLLGATAATAATFGGALAWQRLVADRVAQGPTTATGDTTPIGSVPPVGAQRDTILVLIQLSGGNDALNTLPPSDGRYLDARPTLGVAEGERVALAGTTAYALHPSLAPLATRWEQGRLAALAGIGFEGQSRSHFAALDTWWSADPTDLAGPGWLGRWLDATAAADPTNPLRAVSLGGGAPALVGTSSLVTVIQAPEQFRLLAPPGADADVLTRALLATAAPLADEPLLAAAQAALPTTFGAVDHLARVVTPPAGGAGAGGAGAGGVGGAGRSGQGGGPGALGWLLRTAASILELDLGTRVVQVSANGFDTHANQAADHPRLLADLADGMTAILDAVAAQGRGERVLVAAISEFGRRVQENGSGTDHGFGGLALVAGEPVAAGGAGGTVVGALDLGGLVAGDLPVVLDARSLYAACLDHLGGLGGDGADRGLTDDVLGGTWDRLGLVA